MLNLDQAFYAIRGAATATVAAAIAVVGGLNSPLARATDIEVYFTQVGENTAAPNVLFILDTSQSMYGVENSAPPDPYDPDQDLLNRRL